MRILSSVTKTFSCEKFVVSHICDEQRLSEINERLIYERYTYLSYLIYLIRQKFNFGRRVFFGNNIFIGTTSFTSDIGGLNVEEQYSWEAIFLTGIRIIYQSRERLKITVITLRDISPNARYSSM